MSKKVTKKVKPKDLTRKDLDTLVDVVSKVVPDVTHDEARTAIERIMSQHEAQLKIFLVGVAKSRMNRVLRLMEIIDASEHELLGNADRIQEATTYELTRIWQMAQSTVATDLDFIKQVIDMRATKEEVPATIVNILGNPTNDQLDAARDIPTLEPQQRAKIRNIIDRLLTNGKDE